MTVPTPGTATSPAHRQRCRHDPPCPPASASDHDAARVVSRHPEQGWTLLCNGVVLFEDTGELLPDGGVVAPHRPACRPPRPRTGDPALSA